nr:MAG TPA: minor capsid protein [Caudoviricetes sp.]
MGRYAYKKSLPDWSAQTAADLKIAIKAYILSAVLNSKSDEQIREHVRKEVEEFRQEFSEAQAEEASGYVQELTALAEDVLAMTRNAIGNLTPYMFAAAVAPTGNLTEAQKANIGKAAKLILRPTDRETVRKVAAEYRYKPASGEQTADLPDFAYNRATPAQTYYKDVHEQTRAWMQDFQKIKESRNFVANVNPRAYTEMGVRFDAYRREKARLIQQGVKTVYVAPHANCSLRCQKWQGRVYSLDGFRGVRDGRKVIPIEDAAENVTYTSKRTGRTYQAGLFAYNCRHSMTPYQDGQLVETIPADVVATQRALEERQRAMEREIRFQKEKGTYWEILAGKNNNVGLDKVARSCYGKAAALKKRYIAFSKKNNIPVVPERLSIMQGEALYTRTARGKRDIKDVSVNPDVKI